jgi:hypothetical protein
MTIYGSNRKLLARLEIEVPEGAIAFHTERVGRSQPEIVFIISGGGVKKIPLTDSQRDHLYQQQRYGSLGWDLDV